MPVHSLIGGVVGLASSLFGPKERETTQQFQLDPQTRAFLQQQRQLALQQAQAGPNQFLTQAGQGFGGLTQNLGFASQRGLGGIEQFFNPFQEQVIGGIQTEGDRQLQFAQRASQEQATRAGAFGGSRSAVLQGELQGATQRNTANLLANVRQRGFTQASNQLLGQQRLAANLGLSGLQGMAGVGQSIDAQQLANVQALQGAIGPFQGTSTFTEPLFSNPFAGFLGGAATAGGLFGRFGGGGGSGGSGGGQNPFPSSFGRRLSNF